MNSQIQQGTMERTRKRKCTSTGYVSIERSIAENFETELPVQYFVANPFEFNKTENGSKDRSYATHDQQRFGFSAVMIEQMLEHLNALSKRV